MPWPPVIPPLRTNGTPQATLHASDHNAFDQALADINAAIGPSGPAALLTGVPEMLGTSFGGSGTRWRCAMDAYDLNGQPSNGLVNLAFVGSAFPAGFVGAWQWITIYNNVFASASPAGLFPGGDMNLQKVQLVGNGSPAGHWSFYTFVVCLYP